MRIRSLALASLFLLAACSDDAAAPVTPTTDGGVPFSYSVDAKVQPNSPALTASDGSARPLTTFVDGDGVKTDFVADELLVVAPDDAELASLLTRYQGTVLADNTLVSGQVAPPSVRRVLLRITQPIDSLDGIAADAPALGGAGSYVFGSDAGAHLFATAAHETRAGQRVLLNFAAYGAGGTFKRGTQEAKMNGGYQSAFSVPEFSGTYGANVIGAWQYLDWVGYTPRAVPVAILDGGFWLDPGGNPYDQGLGTDLPNGAPQRSFDPPFVPGNAGGSNGATCTGGTKCEWHGNGSAGVATGLIDNQKGSAGTGGQVASPILLKTSCDDFGVIMGVEAASGLGARVLNMSFGSSCNGACRFGRYIDGYLDAMKFAILNGVILVASAGNDNVDVDVEHYYPCTLGGVICVGAHDGSGNGYSYSNYGAGVTLFAPTDIPVMPDGATQTPIHNGTSAAAPFVSGVVAMVLSHAPTLGPLEMKNLLVTTAHPSPSVPKVGQTAGYLDARAAVELAGNYLPPDIYEPNDVYTQATTVSGDVKGLTLSKGGDKDYYRFTLTDYAKVSLTIENMWEGFPRVSPVPVVESGPGNPEGIVQKNTPLGYSYSSILMPPGTYRFLATGGVQPYDLGLGIENVGLTPDYLEDNDLVATARYLYGTGLAGVNLHVDTDVDHYSFHTPLLASNELMLFDIVSADMPVTMDLLDAAGTLIKNSGSILHFGFDDTKQNTDFIVRITGTRGRYGFDYQKVRVPTIVPPQLVSAQVPWLDPSDPNPWNGVLRDSERFLGFTATNMSPVGLPAATAVSFTSGSMLHAELLDATGKLVAAGVPAAAGGETMDLAGTTPGQDYFVHIVREIAGTDPDAALPALPFQAGFVR